MARRIPVVHDDEDRRNLGKMQTAAAHMQALQREIRAAEHSLFLLKEDKCQHEVAVAQFLHDEMGGSFTKVDWTALNKWIARNPQE